MSKFKTGKRRAVPAEASAEGLPKVKIRPLFGIAPQVYVPPLLAGIVAILLVLIFIVPGIVRFGSVVRVYSDPAAAAVYVDGMYRGATPLELFVPAGVYELEVVRPYFEPYRGSVTVFGRRVGSLFAPRRLMVERVLRLEDWDGLAREAAARVAALGLIGEATASYQFDPVLAEAVTDLRAGRRQILRESGAEGAETNDPERAREAEEISETIGRLLDSAKSSLVSPALLKDWLHAYTLFLTDGNPPHGGHLVSLLAGLAAQLDAADVPASAIAQLLPADAVDAEPFLAVLDESYDENIAAGTVWNRPAEYRRVQIEGIGFVSLPAGEFVMGAYGQNQDSLGSTAPHRTAIEPFYIMQDEMTRAQFARFVRAAGVSRDETEMLFRCEVEVEAEGEGAAEVLAADIDGALADWERFPDNLPVTNIRVEGMEAFADWLTGRLPPAFRDFYVRLPIESEWEWAAFHAFGGSVERVAAQLEAAPASAAQYHIPYINHIDADGPRPIVPAAATVAGGAPIYNLIGNVWEMMGNWYFPAHYGMVPLRPKTESLPGAAVAVRGGSYLDAIHEIDISTRGSQPPDWCSPYVGFRLAMAARPRLQ